MHHPRSPRRRAATRLLALAALALALLPGARPAFAATLTVTSAGDAGDANPGNGACATSGGVCTLRAAIEEANATPALDTIRFAIAGAPLIRPATPLPYITAPLTIDGASQGDWVELEGSLITEVDIDGLRISSGGAGSTISGLAINSFNGTNLNLYFTDNITVRGNRIGVNPAGTAVKGTTTRGIYVVSSTNVTIGGTISADANLIAGPQYLIWSSGSQEITVRGNLLGTNASGTALLGGANIAILVQGSTQVTLGGTSAGAGNLIAGASTGISLAGGSQDTVIQGNLIGTDLSGTLPLPNGWGVRVIQGSLDTLIGGTAAGAGNLIAFNTLDGISVADTSARAQILGNQIRANDRMGIDLGDSGVTPNDPGDGDTGPNNLQNYPVLASAVTSGGSTTVSGSLNSAASTAFTIELYQNAACDPNGYGEGATFLRRFTATTNASGNAAISQNFTSPLPLGSFVTATATDPQGNTSEFGACAEVRNPPTLSIADRTVTEGNAGTVNADFTVTLAPASSQAVTVQYATSNGTATAGSDYTAASGTLTFAPGETSKTVAVSVLGDTLDEPDETFNVTLSSPTNAAISDGAGLGTITDDDGAPTLSIADRAVTEGNAGSVAANFTVTLSAASAQAVTVQYATSNGTATAGSDYTAASGTLTFAPGETSKTVAVSVLGDTLDEPDETYTVTLSSPTNAAISDGAGLGTITDDDGAPTLSIADRTVTEGNTGTVAANFTVTLSAASAQAVTVQYATSNGTATAGSDYTAAAGALAFAPGETSKTIAVTVLGDTLNESDETFTVTLGNATNATISDGSATGTIQDDDDSRVYLPLIFEFQPKLLATINGAAIPIQPVTTPGAAFYTATITLPTPLPAGAFYLSGSPASLTPGLVDDGLIIRAGATEIFRHDYGATSRPTPALVPVPRSALEPWAGQPLTIQFVDFHGSVTQASPLYLVWQP